MMASRCEDYMGDSDMRRVMGVLIHGDAAFCGQAQLNLAADDEIAESSGFVDVWRVAMGTQCLMYWEIMSTSIDYLLPSRLSSPIINHPKSFDQ